MKKKKKRRFLPSSFSTVLPLPSEQTSRFLKEFLNLDFARTAADF